MARFGRQNKTTETILTTIVGEETVAAGRSAIPVIEVPLAGFAFERYTAVITWKDGSNIVSVEGFESSRLNEIADDNDIGLEVVSSEPGITATIAKQSSPDPIIIQNSNPGFTGIYYLPLVLTGSGTAKITIPQGAATYNGIDSPDKDVSIEFVFNIPSENFPTISGVFPVCIHQFSVQNNSWLDTALGGSSPVGGMFLGTSDMLVHNDRVYAVVQIQKKGRGRSQSEVATMSTTSSQPQIPSRPSDVGNDEINELEQAGAALISAPTAGGACTVHESYPFITAAPRSPSVYTSSDAERAHYFIGSHYIYSGRGTPRVAGSPRKDLWEDTVGWVIEVVGGSTQITQAFLGWRSKLPQSNIDRYLGIHGGTSSPIRMYDEDLFLYLGRSDLDFVDRAPPTADYGLGDDVVEATEETDWQLINYSKNLNARIDYLSTNDRSGWSILEELALLTNSVIGFNRNRFIFKSRIPTIALLSTEIDASASSLQYTKATRDLPNNGTVVINSEIINYSTRTDTELKGLSRGIQGSGSREHEPNSKIFFIDYILNANSFSRPINELSINSDTTNLYNDVRLSYAEGFGLAPIKSPNERSIAANTHKVLEKNVPLSFHQGKWVKFIADLLLETFGDIQYNLDLTLKPSPHLSITDVILVEEPLRVGLFRVAQILSITHENSDPPVTQVIARTLSYSSRLLDSAVSMSNPRGGRHST